MSDRRPLPERPRVGVISLGCSKNLVDTEVMLGHLDRAGCTFVADSADADVILVNTCSFIGPAREESIQTILEAAELKKTGRLRRLVVAGCMVQRYAEELRENLPEVDAFIGLDELDRVAEGVGVPTSSPSPVDRAAGPISGGDAALPMARSGVSSPDISPTAIAAWGPAEYLYDHETPRRLATSPWTAYVKIAEGCDHTCAFCAIPGFRGEFRSRPIDSIVTEARGMASKGVREVNLIAQDSSHYGRDRGGEEDLAGLLEGLSGVDGLDWIRVHYLYPNTITPRLIEAMATLPRVVDYVDLPLQHADTGVLKAMRRGGNADGHTRLLERFRSAMPDVALRTTFIVGFPGETDEAFERLLQFVDEVRFEHVGVFTYSHEERTPAEHLTDDVPEEVKLERQERLMERQRTIVLRHHQERVGRQVEVLCEGTHPETEHLLVGRMRGQAPDVDGQVLINDGAAEPGELVQVELTEVAGYDLVGRVVTRERRPATGA